MPHKLRLLEPFANLFGSTTAARAFKNPFADETTALGKMSKMRLCIVIRLVILKTCVAGLEKKP